ncbi:MAG: hypothetical protein PHE52_01980 [Candidatus Pacebacteria bacterium]|nr:hypothetical protein [Candidatus Paceibacterota bacterium]
MNIEKIESVYSQGTSKQKEDGFVVNYPFFGVVDGFSAPFSYKAPPMLFSRRTGGEMVRKTVLETFYSASSSTPLEDLLLRANQKVAKIQMSRGIPLERTDLLAAVSFVFARLDKDVITLIQGGDCLAVWSYGPEEFGVTKNQAYLHVSGNLKIIEGLLRKNHNDVAEMWVDFCPILSQRRLQDTNNPESKAGYAVLNGQPVFKELWQKIEIPTRNLRYLLLFSDGFIPYGLTQDETKLAKDVISIYEAAGIPTLLRRKRRTDKKNEKKSYIARDEATAVAIEFSK